jgi:triacylglycerol esterase/lipase EstA (alpha/beta hydrolase family)
MLRIAFTLLLAAATAAAHAATATTGVAFVHGTGSQTDAYNDYWQPTMVNTVKNGLVNKNNVVVINCDFEQYMWDSRAAGCLATQLTGFLATHNVTDLVVITHSNGGNVMRWIMSNPTYDSRYPAIISKVRWVNALAPSSAGTPLADAVIAGNVFENALGWLLGYQSDAVRQQQRSWMAYYNQNNLYGTAGRPALPKGFWDVIGSDVETAV